MPEQIDADLRQGAKAAAAAAAVGAAVGVARALATRAEHASRKPEHVSQPEQEPEQEREPEEEYEQAPQQEQEQEREHEEREPVKGEGAGTLRRVTETARALLQELSGADVESVTALDRTPDGWRVTLEAVEVRRIPDSTDVLGTYDVELDGDCDLVRYERRRRYSRAQSDHGDAR
jgi:hypothetical protein